MSDLILTSKEMVNGKTVNKPSGGAFLQPLQFIPREDKTDQWCMENLDFLEYQGLRQIFDKAPKMLKNYNFSKGIIDKSDYLPTTTPENADLLSALLEPEKDDNQHLQLRFYPIIPKVIQTLRTEFSKRNSKMMFMTADEYSYNEILDQKYQEIGSVLTSDAEKKLSLKLIDAGMDPETPEFKQALSQENIRSLPEIQEYYTKGYRSMLEEWASHQMEDDNYRFHMDELEEKNFTNSITVDEQYWHFRMMEDDYVVEDWNPMFTFSFKSPQTRYVSEGFAVGNVQLMTIADILDNYGHRMSQEQQESLQRIYPQANAAYAITGYDASTYYDNTKTPEENNVTSLAMKQVLSMTDNQPTDMLTRLMSPSSYIGPGNNFLGRVTTIYWKSQRKLGLLTKISESGEVTTTIVDESYDVTDEPVYNNTLIQNKDAMTLVFGEHVEWTWINQTWGGVKIGPNVPSYNGMSPQQNASGLQPMYIGINQNEVAPLKYQFKGDNSLYGCKLPVEGATFSDYNTKVICPVDLLAPFQIGYNVVQNQIQDILVDELGTIIALDPNQLPNESLGEDWGKQNIAKAYGAMKTLGILPLDKSLQHTESAGSSNAPLQFMDLSQTNRLMGKIQLATYFHNEGLSMLGITPQRLGTPSPTRQTATGVEQDLEGSYKQTEMYFIQHSDYLMPRVHQMRTDLAQYYHSTKESVRLSYINSKEERVFFEINGTDLLLRDINVYPVSTATNRNVVEELRKLLITNNTTGALTHELGNLLTANSLGEMNNILKGMEAQAQQKYQDEQSRAMELQKQKEESDRMELQMELDHEAQEKEKDRRTNILIAEIRAAGYSGAMDLDQNMRNDYMDNLEMIRKSDEFSQSMGMKRESEVNKMGIAREKLNLDRQKLNTQVALKQMDVEIARENTTGSELAAKKKLEKRKKERKTKK